MSRLIMPCVATLLVLGCTGRAENPKAAAPATTIPLAGVQGRIDHMAVDDKGSRLFIAALGNDTLEVIDLKAGKVADRISGLRAPQGVAFAPDLNRLAVANDKRAVIAKWRPEGAADNFPMALDESNHRLFIGCRKPAKLLVLDTESGKTVASVDCAGDTDDVFYDAALKQVYVSGGEGYVTVVRQSHPDRYEVTGKLQTAKG